MKKVLVAGSTGYSGKFVVQEFKRQGYWLRALTRNQKKLSELGPFGEPQVLDLIDDVFVGEVSRTDTLTGLCKDIDIVFSSIGLTRQKDGLSFQDVDYQGNKNILDQAIKEGVQQFIYVSVLNAHLMEHLDIVKAHEDFVRVLRTSGIPYTIIRPTGYFSDISEYFKMAKSGRVYLIGNGENRLNPIHGVDLAKVCVDAVEDLNDEIPVGGPSIFTQREIAELAFSALGKPSKISTIPLGLAKAAIRLMRLFSRHTADLFEFFVTGAEHDMVAPQYGDRSLRSYFQQLAYASGLNSKVVIPHDPGA
ncbi:MAG: SDR family oxidoreductase [Anaerolineales bacterium]